MLQSFEALPMHTLLLQGSDLPFHHAILLRTVERDELLAQVIASDEGRVFARREDQPVVNP